MPAPTETSATPAPSAAELPAVPALSDAALDRLRAALAAVQFAPAGLRSLWGVSADRALDADDGAPARRTCLRLLTADPAAAAADTRRAVCALLFVLGDAVPESAAEAALGADLAAELRGAGLLLGDEPASAADAHLALREADAVRSALSLRAHALPVGIPRGLRAGDEHLLLFSDFGALARSGPLAGGFVLGWGGAGRTLLEITPRDRVSLAADIGTGCGVQAVVLARHSERVIATDISARALAIAALSAGIAGCRDRIDFRLGSLFEPLDEPVDLFVSNPPFVITPRAEANEDGADDLFEYRDGGLTGDGIMRAMVTGVPGALAPGGQAAMLGNWESGPGRTPPEKWELVAPASLMIVEREVLDPVDYARLWIRDGGVQPGSARWQADMTAWLDDFADRSVERIGFGWVRMRRLTDAEAGSGAAVCSVRSELTGPIGSNPAGLAHFLDLRLGILEWLAGCSDEELAATAFVRAGDVTEHRHLTPGAEDPTMITIEQGAGLGQSFTADPALAGLLGVADGTLTLGQTADALAALLEVDPRGLRAQLIAQVRELLPAGVLTPAV